MQETAKKESKGFEELNKELEKVIEIKQTEAKETKAAASKKRAAKKIKAITTSARRKTAIARATLTKGEGRLTFNNFNVYALENRIIKERIIEPINMSVQTREIARDSDISVNVYGGGESGQMQAARSAIARVIWQASQSDAVKDMYLKYDRALIVDDIRQVEPKKYKGPKARARFQKSYR